MGMLNNHTLAEAQAGLAKGDFSSRELTESHIEAIEIARDLNIFVTETPERALADAEASDKRRITGQVGALDGLPIAIKDLFCTRGIKSTASSHMLESFVPPYESTVTAKMLEAGMVMLGKTNLDEFAMGSSNETSFFGPVINPWKRNSDNNSNGILYSAASERAATTAGVNNGPIKISTSFFTPISAASAAFSPPLVSRNNNFTFSWPVLNSAISAPRLISSPRDAY